MVERRRPKPDYEVGYRKPPTHSRFKPGQSGNPKGRPKGANNLKTDLGKELSERVHVSENGRRIGISKQRLLVKALTAKAVKGDTRAASILINLIAQTIGLDPKDQRAAELTSSDVEILEIFRDRVLSGAAEVAGNTTASTAEPSTDPAPRKAGLPRQRLKSKRVRPKVEPEK